MNNPLIVVRGGGDIATGTIYKLKKAGFRVIGLEIAEPSFIRRTVSLAQCIYSGNAIVEGLHSKLAASVVEALHLAQEGTVPFLIDPFGHSIWVLKPLAVIDATLSKKSHNTSINMANIVIGLGPGFVAGATVHAVIETMRGHDLGRVYWEGEAFPDTGIPESVQGIGAARVVRSSGTGQFYSTASISDMVEAGDALGMVSNNIIIRAPISGIVRGLINDGVYVTTGMKIGDIDPRNEQRHCITISDKARAIGGGVLEAVFIKQKFPAT